MTWLLHVDDGTCLPLEVGEVASFGKAAGSLLRAREGAPVEATLIVHDAVCFLETKDRVRTLVPGTTFEPLVRRRGRLEREVGTGSTDSLLPAPSFEAFVALSKGPDVGRLLSAFASRRELALECDAAPHVALAGLLDSFFWGEGRRPDARSAQDAANLLGCAWARLKAQGPLTPLLRDESITEIMVFGEGQCFVERRGRIEELPWPFTELGELRSLMERIVSRAGRRLDEASPACDCRLPDGSRVHAIVPPLALDGPCLTIRKFRKSMLTADDLVQGGSATRAQLVALEERVRAKRNIVVAGGTGTGKTTLLNVVSSFIPEGERVLTIEDSAELRLSQRHVVRLEARQANVEGKGTVDVRALVRHALRMRPDRIVVGECRGGEALDMLQAMNTGHDGSLTTIHANSPLDALRRLETLCLFSGVELPLRALREQIASSVQTLVFLERLADGRRRIRSIADVAGLDPDTGSYSIRECEVEATP